MREVSRRFLARLSEPNEWQTKVLWSNDGGWNWQDATFVSGTATASSLSQMRWACSLQVEAPFGLDGINPYTTRIMIRHGMAGEPLLPMGVHKVKDATAQRDGLVSLTGRSFETYLIAARFDRLRTFQRQPARLLIEQLVKEILPAARFNWVGVDEDRMLPRLMEAKDRWGLIDGRTDGASVARALGARVFCDASGVWTVALVPALTDPAVFEVAAGEGGVLVEDAEQLTDEGVYNVIVVTGEPVTDQATGRVLSMPKAVVSDVAPDSPTRVTRSPDAGGSGRSTRYYDSQMITTNAQALTAARALLAPSLGLKQKITFTTLPQPHLEPGDVGIVHTVRGERRVILDEVTYDLNGGPLQTQTRTTETRLQGDQVAAEVSEGGE